jgi:eukaryotic-like serine/threonine-protein kinase
MTPEERWQQVNSLFHAARACPGDKARQDFLARACVSDESLRREVESLLAQPEATQELIVPGLPLERAAEIMNRTDAPTLIGRRLGVYEVTARLGAGGMGEVYRARDTRLERDVAIKILPSEFTSDRDRLARFEREARTLAALNHPNIAAIYGVEEADGRQALILELVDGQTLAEMLDRGALPLKEALGIATQIAEALEAAHDKGIIHRDLKPGNVALTLGGVVKVLDFGLAKATIGKGSGAPAMTAGGTRDGVVLGTPAYMSPEQARGQAVDKRTDIWAFGCVLLEMLTGHVAFRGNTVADTIAAVLEREPDWSALPAATPGTIRRLLERCLAKDPKRRLRDIGDARIELDDALTGRSAPSDASGRQRTTTRRWLALAALAAAMLLAGVGLAVFLSQTPAPSFEQLTFRRGRIGGARFAAGGVAVVYSEASDGHALEISRVDLPDTSSWRPLGYPPGSEILAARAGELALSLDRRFVLGERFVGTLALAPLGGGAPREIAENVEDADWEPSGPQLAVVRSTGDAMGQSWIEFPLGHVLHKTTGSIRFLRVSRDGQRLAFVEEALARGISGHIAVVDLNGRVTELTNEWASVRGLAWSASGKEIWFAAGAVRSNRALRAVNLERRERVVLEAPGSLTLWDIAADGRVLLGREEERRAVVAVPPGETAERDLSWFDDSGLSDISDDGRFVLCGDRSGVYLRATDGSPPIRLLNEGFADDLSPDGKTVLATIESGRTLVLVPRGAGDRRRLPKQGFDVYRGAWWFPDGHRILFTGGAGGETGEESRSYIQDVNGGLPKPLTPEGTRALAISPKGDQIAVVAKGQPISIWPVAGGPPRSVPGTLPDDRPVGWSVDGRSLWLFRRGEVPAHVYQLDIETGRRRLWKTLVPPDAAGVYSISEFRITPTGHAYAYSYVRLLSQLYLVRGPK